MSYACRACDVQFDWDGPRAAAWTRIDGGEEVELTDQLWLCPRCTRDIDRDLQREFRYSDHEPTNWEWWGEARYRVRLWRKDCSIQQYDGRSCALGSVPQPSEPSALAWSSYSSEWRSPEPASQSEWWSAPAWSSDSSVWRSPEPSSQSEVASWGEVASTAANARMAHEGETEDVQMDPINEDDL